MNLEDVSREADAALRSFARQPEVITQRPPPSVTAERTVLQSATGVQRPNAPSTRAAGAGAETVTGAVNGVPATLVILTEGSWTEI